MTATTHPAGPQKSLDAKLARIVADPHSRDFILADAKDADMAFGLAATGVTPGGDPARGPYRSLNEYHDQIREIVKQGLVDIMLMSGSTSERLTIDEGIFAASAVTPAVRMNDTTDIWLAAGSGNYGREPALPFSTTTISQAQCGRVECSAADRGRGAWLVEETQRRLRAARTALQAVPLVDRERRIAAAAALTLGPQPWSVHGGLVCGCGGIHGWLT